MRRAIAVLVAVAFLLGGLFSPSILFSSPQQDFIDRQAVVAQEIVPQYGLFVSVYLAQAALESGWGTSSLATQGNNYFGRKCGHSPCIKVWTDEWRNGQMVREEHYFQRYETLQEAIRDYCQKYLRTWASGYPVYYIDTSSPFAFVDGITGNGEEARKYNSYATDPKYGNKLKSIIVQWDLERYDRPLDEKEE